MPTTPQWSLSGWRYRMPPKQMAAYKLFQEQQRPAHCGKSQTAIADNFLDETQAIPLPVRSGGVVLFHPLTPHASLDNMTGTFRWSFDIRYNRTGQLTGRSHFSEFIARSQTAPETVLSDWQEWKQMWETARAQLSGQSHIPISRWTSTSPFCA